MKKNKANYQRTKSFLQGANQTLDFTLQYPFFAEFKYLKDFALYLHTRTSFYEEANLELLNAYLNTKKSFEKFYVQIGKLKGYQFCIEA